MGLNSRRNIKHVVIVQDGELKIVERDFTKHQTSQLAEMKQKSITQGGEKTHE